jgi:hypothetical protein
MTIVEHAPDPAAFTVTQPITVDVPPVLAPASEPAPQSLERPSRLHRLAAFSRRRQYNHPRRERFVEEAAMSREMFRL